MSTKVQVKKQPIKKPTSVKPPTTVSFENGFHFYTAIGNYTGITATNLSEFATKLQIIPKESITFHFQRKDFQKWVEYTIKDAALAERISRANGEQSAEDLRKEILRTVET
jgi:alpha-amylase